VILWGQDSSPASRAPGATLLGCLTDVGVAAKRLELLKAAQPKLSRVVELRNPTTAAELLFRETQAAARTLGIEIHLIDVRDPGELERAFSMMANTRAEALNVIADPMFPANGDELRTSP
jgi:putative ABC transport system substrate-binding protein